MKKQIVFGAIFCLFLISFVYAEALISDAGVEYESDIVDDLNGSEWVEVIIETYSKNKTILEGMLFSLTKDEFKLEEIFLESEGLVGNITKKGFDKLINNSDVKLIYLNRIAHILGNETITETSEEIQTEKRSLLWFYIISGIILTIILYFIIKRISKNQ